MLTNFPVLFADLDVACVLTKRCACLLFGAGRSGPDLKIGVHLIFVRASTPPGDSCRPLGVEGGLFGKTLSQCTTKSEGFAPTLPATAPEVGGAGAALDVETCTGSGAADTSGAGSIA